jgi:hypothetical protein
VYRAEKQQETQQENETINHWDQRRGVALSHAGVRTISV